MNAKSWAYIKFNDDFIFIETYSGYFNCLPDPEGVRIYLSHPSTDIELGKSILEALSASRTIDPKLSPDFFDFRGRVAVQYESWVADLMSRFGYKTRRALFKNMKSCSVDAVGDVITMRPSHHEKLEAWTGKGIAEKDHVVVSSCCSHEEIGAALRLGLSRCT